MVETISRTWLRDLYTGLFRLSLPLVLFRLYWRGIKAPAYRLRWSERLGYYGEEPRFDVIWFHAVSVGEAEAAFTLIKLMQTQNPDSHFLVTTTTPTGSARVQSVLGNSVHHVYLPYDIPAVIKRFLDHFRPKIGIIMEKEIWPNLFAGCAARRIPLFIVNARLSARSAASYRKIPALVKPALAAVERIIVQTGDDRDRFITIGARPESLEVSGNLKFDVRIDEKSVAAGRVLKKSQFQGRYVWIVASSHQGEEVVFLKLYRQLKPQIPELLLLIAPRHPERFSAVKSLCVEHRLAVVMRSEGQFVNGRCDVYVADSMGELKMLYAAADVAFVGGSIAPVGGHNVLEPAALGLPVLFGPHMFNFQDIAERMLAAGAALQCPDEAAVAEVLLRLIADDGFAAELAANARLFVERNQGATVRVAEILESYL